MQCQVYVPTYDIPAPAPINYCNKIIMHTKEIYWCHMQEQMYTFILPTHGFSMEQISYQKQLKKLNHWIFLNQARAGRSAPGFLELLLSASVCMRVCLRVCLRVYVCVCPPLRL